MATTPLTVPATAPVHCKKASWNFSGSIIWKTRFIVSCEGIPLGSSKGLPNPLPPCRCPVFYLIPCIHATKHCCDGDYDDIKKFMFLIVRCPRVWDFPHIPDQRTVCCFFHKDHLIHRLVEMIIHECVGIVIRYTEYIIFFSLLEREKNVRLP